MSACLLLVGANGGEPPSVVRARRFELVAGDAGNVVLAEMSATPSGEGAIITYNTKGYPVADLRPRADGRGWVTTYDGQGRALVELGATSEGDGAIGVSAANGFRLVMLRSLAAGGAVMTFNREGYPLVELSATPEGRGKVKTVDARGAEIQLTDDVTGYLRASEISRDRVEDARNVLKEGDEVEAMIINVDRKVRSIQLSVKAKDSADQQEAMQRLSQTSERENAGTTSLGALLRAKMDNKE